MNHSNQKVYKVKKVQMCLYVAALTIIALNAVISMTFFFGEAPIFVRAFFIIIGFFTLYATYRLWRVYQKAKDLVLSFSETEHNFSIGSGSNIRVFNKTEIAKITCYGSKGNRGPNLMAIMKIDFTSGETISFPGMLIPLTDFLLIFENYNVIRKLNPRDSIRATTAFTK